MEYPTWRTQINQKNNNEMSQFMCYQLYRK